MKNRNFIFVLLSVLVLLPFAGCEKATKSTVVFEGVITDIRKDGNTTTLLLENGELQASVSADGKTVIENGNLIIGADAVVAFDGAVSETEPIQGKAARITLCHGVKKKAETISPDADASPLKGLTLYRKTEYDFNDDGTAETVGLYTAAELDGNGGLILDDGQDWAVAVTGKDGMYPLFPRQYVQLGSVDYSLYFSYEDEQSHVLVTLKQGTAIKLIDYAFNKGQNVFQKNDAFQSSNINLIG